MRPLLERIGDGSCTGHEVHLSTFNELPSHEHKDIQTLKSQMEAGSGPVDDKTMF